MTANPLVLRDVWKSFGNVEAVRGLSLSVPPQSVYGFLGPNGAGKSTTIRMILGLQRPNRGSIDLFGQSLEKESNQLLSRIGALVESPSLYAHLTGRENLEVHRLLLGLPKQANDEALATVGLIPVADRIVRGYSSGMRQRLGLAQALLGNPDLLLLDEPTNTLDPVGIHEVRTLIRDLPKSRGTTVFLSSHLLAEVEQTATHVAIISQGQVKYEGTLAQLRTRSQPFLAVQVDLPDSAISLLGKAGLSASCHDNWLRMPLRDGFRPSEINRLLVQHGIGVMQLITEHPTLEQTFLELTGVGTKKGDA